MADDESVLPWVPADDDLLPGRVRTVTRVLEQRAADVRVTPEADAEAVPSLTSLAADLAADLDADLAAEFAVPARPIEEPLLAPASDGDFWRRGLAPLQDFSDVLSLPDIPIGTE